MNTESDFGLSAMTEPELVVDPFADVEPAVEVEDLAPTQVLPTDEPASSTASLDDEALAPTQVVEHVVDTETQASQQQRQSVADKSDLYTAEESSEEDDDIPANAEPSTDGVKKVYMDYDLLSSESDSDDEAAESNDAAAPATTAKAMQSAASSDSVDEQQAADVSKTTSATPQPASTKKQAAQPEQDNDATVDEDEEEAMMRATDDVDEEEDAEGEEGEGEDDGHGAVNDENEEMAGFIRDSSGTDESDSNDGQSDDEGQEPAEKAVSTDLATADEDEDADESYGDDDGDIKSLLKRKPVVARQVVPAHIQLFIAEIKQCVRQALGLQAKLAPLAKAEEPQPVKKLTHAELLQQKVTLQPKIAVEATMTLDEDELMSLSDDEDDAQDEDDELDDDLIIEDVQLVTAKPLLANDATPKPTSNGEDDAESAAALQEASALDAVAMAVVDKVIAADEEVVGTSVTDQTLTVETPSTLVTAESVTAEVSTASADDTQTTDGAAPAAAVSEVVVTKVAVKRKTFDDLAEDHHLAKMQNAANSSDEEVDEEQQRREAARRSMKRHKFKHQKQVQRTKSQALERTSSHNSASDHDPGTDEAMRTNSNDHLITRAVTSGAALLGATIRRTNTGLPLARHPSGMPPAAASSPTAASSALHSPAPSVVPSSSGLMPMMSRLHSKVNSLLGRNNSNHGKADETSLQATRAASSAQATKAYVFKRADSTADASNKENVTAKDASTQPSSRTSSNTGKLSSEVAKQAFNRAGSSHMQHTPMLLAGSSGLQRTGAIGGGGRGNSLLMTALAKSQSIKRPVK